MLLFRYSCGKTYFRRSISQECMNCRPLMAPVRKKGGGRQEYIREGMRWILSLETEQGMGMCRRFYGLEEMAGVFLPERFHHELSLRLIDAEYLSGHSGTV